jgi:hypothetical protein
MTVTGCPLIVDKSTYGMTKEKLTVYRSIDEPTPAAADKEVVARKARDMLSFGTAPFNADPITRELYVQNNGSMPGRVMWKVRAIVKEKMNGPVKLSLNVESVDAPNVSPPRSAAGSDRPSSGGSDKQDAEGAGAGAEEAPENDGEADSPEVEDDGVKEVLKVKTQLDFWSDLAKDAPYSITPADAIIPPYGKQKFKVTLFRTSGETNEGEAGMDLEDMQGGADASKKGALELAELIGEVKFVPSEPTISENSLTSKTLEGQGLVDIIDTDALPEASASVESTLIPHDSPADQTYRLNMLLQGRLVYPTIIMDKNTLVATSSETILSMEEGGIKFKSEANSLFGMKKVNGKRGTNLAQDNGSKDCNRIVTLKNPTDTTLVCTVSTAGQFALKLAVDDSAASKAAKAKADKIKMSQTGPGAIRTSVGGDSNGRIITLLPLASTSFVISFQPSRGMRDTITQTKQATAAVGSNDEEGNLIIAFNTGQRLFMPLLGSIATPFLVGSAPKMVFGTCKVGFSTNGTMLLTNPTQVMARWVVKHVPVPTDARAMRNRENAKNKVKVPGYEYPGPETDDPSVFILTPSAGAVSGPTVSVEAATAAPPKDLNRGGGVEEVVPQRLAEASWATSTLTHKDTMDNRYKSQGQFEADARFPLPIEAIFKPKGDKKYVSRFRFICEYGNFFDVILSGNGTYEEHEHMPLQPKPV